MTMKKRSSTCGLKTKKELKCISDIENNYCCQFWFMFTFIPIMFILSCMFLHKEKEAEAAT